MCGCVSVLHTNASNMLFKKKLYKKNFEPLEIIMSDFAAEPLVVGELRLGAHGEARAVGWLVGWQWELRTSFSAPPCTLR